MKIYPHYLVFSDTLKLKKKSRKNHFYRLISLFFIIYNVLFLSQMKIKANSL